MPVKAAVKEKDRKSSGRFERTGESLREIRTELRKVVWPTRQEAIKLTVIVIGVSAAVGVFLGGVDATFAYMFSLLLQ